MTISSAKNKILDLAKSHIGYHEEYNNGNIFARDSETAKAYGWNIDHLAWCDIFFDYLFCHTFGAELAKQMTYQTNGMSAACANSMELYNSNWVLFKTPQIGDQIFFYVSGGVNHTGIVSEVNGFLIKTIEGNTSDGVHERIYQLGDSSIAGYGRPNWELVEDDADDGDTAAETPVEAHKYSYLHLVYGDGLNAPEERVEALQHLLRLHGALIDADGEFGRMTENAVVKFRKERNIGDSGETDEFFWKELIKFEV